MVKYKLVILFLFIGLSSFAQQGLQMDFGEIDSTEMQVQRNAEYHQFINGTFGNDMLAESFKLPRLSLLEGTQNDYTVGLNLTSGSVYMGDGFAGAWRGAPATFYNTAILSQAAYKMGDKFVVGGFSYGANDIMAPGATQMQNSYFQNYGSTMFMKYKVSKKVSIETSISVNQNRRNAFGF